MKAYKVQMRSFGYYADPAWEDVDTFQCKEDAEDFIKEKTINMEYGEEIYDHEYRIKEVYV